MTDVIVKSQSGEFEEILTGVNTDTFVERWQENTSWEIDFEVEKITASNVSAGNEFAFEMLTHESSVFIDNQEFVVKKMNYSAQGSKLVKKVTAPHVYFTCQNGYQYNALTGTKSALECLNFIFSGQLGDMGFSYEVVDKNNILEKVEQENFGNGNYLKLINEVLEDYGLAILADNKHLTFVPLEDYGERLENDIRYQYNTDSLTIDIDTLSMKTQIKGYGKKKEDGTYYFSPVTYTSPQAENYGVRIQDPIVDDRYTSAGNMNRRLKLDLQDYPATVVQTSLRLAYNPTKGDFVMLIYEPLNICYDVKIVGYVKYLLIEQKPPEITLSNTKKTATKIISQIVKNMKGAR
ncbi:phage tail protein [Listeria seeligeri]|uniref:phage tail protein n=1 Tax=Listeria seeligeri TaxID=1640 RepID=UPI0022EBF10F|nr:phage tail protein [Listeria seeligeri]